MHTGGFANQSQQPVVQPAQNEKPPSSPGNPPSFVVPPWQVPFTQLAPFWQVMQAWPPVPHWASPVPGWQLVPSQQPF